MFDSSPGPSPTAALFDFDGTLVDASAAICASFNDVLRQRGKPLLAHEAIRPMIGRPLRDMFREAGVASTHEEAEDCIAIYRAAFMPRSVSQSTLLPGVAESIPKLSSHMKLGVVTNRMSDGAWRMLRAHGLDQHFSTVVGIERVEHAKPDPEPVFLALQELGASAHQAFLVGDTVDDVLAGIRAGVTSVGVTTGSTSRDALTQAGAQKVVDRIDDLLPALGW